MSPPKDVMWQIEFDKSGRKHFDKLDLDTQRQIWHALQTEVVPQLNRQLKIKDHDMQNYFWPARCGDHRILLLLRDEKKTAFILDVELRPIPGR